jgi:hypothetical protein
MTRYVELVDAARRQIVVDALTASGGNRTLAARALGVMEAGGERPVRIACDYDVSMTTVYKRRWVRVLRAGVVIPQSTEVPT